MDVGYRAHPTGRLPNARSSQLDTCHGNLKTTIETGKVVQGDTQHLSRATMGRWCAGTKKYQHENGGRKKRGRERGRLTPEMKESWECGKVSQRGWGDPVGPNEE